MKNLFSTIILTCFFSFSIFAQQLKLDPVKWDFSVNQVSEKEYELVFDANMDKGWYLYSQDMEDDGPVPTTFNFDENTTIQLADSIAEVGELKEGYDELFEMNIKKYADKVSFTTLISVLDTTNKVITGHVRYMTCEEQRCLPPKELPFEFKF